MQNYAVSKIEVALSEQGRSVNHTTILILGIAYKKGINDIGESPALRITELLHGKGATICYSDPNDPSCDEEGVGAEPLKYVELMEVLLKGSDCVVIVTDHSCYDYEWIVRNSNTLVDLRNACPKATELPEETTVHSG